MDTPSSIAPQPTIAGGAGNDVLNGTSGNDVIDGGAGSDVIKAGAGNDTMIFRLSQNAGAADVYTGGSGVDTVLLELTQAEWTDTAVRAELERYITFLGTVSRNAHGEVSNGSASDFTFRFQNGSTLTVQMTEQLAVAVQNTLGQYVTIDYGVSIIKGPSTGSVTEAGGVANADRGIPTATGDLYADDLNGKDDAFRAVALGAAAHGTYSVTSTGVWTYTLNNADSGVQALDAGSTLTDTFTVYTQDGASQLVTVTINGANDAPLAMADAAAGTEKQTLTLDVLANDTDPDAKHVLSLVSASGLAGKGTASVVNNQLVFNPGTAFDHLAAGATEVVTVNYTMQDEHGATSSSTATITITGTDDAPVAVADTASDTETGKLTLDVLANDTDADDGHSFTLLSAAARSAEGIVAIANNQLVFDPHSAFKHLAQGDIKVVTIDYLMEDEFHVTSTSTETITITGSNDAPVATYTTAQSAIEDGAILHGQLTSTDADDGATAAYALVGDPIAGLTLDSKGAWSFDPSNAAYQYLVEKAQQDVIVKYTVSDGQGGTDQASFTITVTGTNDAPVALADTNRGFEDTIITGTVAANDSDGNGGAGPLTYTLITPVAGLTLNSDGSYSFDARNAAYQHLAAGNTSDVVAEYNVTNQYGLPSKSTLTITLTGTYDAPVGTSPDLHLTEDDPIFQGQLTSTYVDDGASTKYQLPTEPVAGLTFDSSGTFTFNPGDKAYQHLPQSTNQAIHVNYGIDDGISKANGNFTIVVTGTNDAPIVAAALAHGAAEGTSSFTQNLLQGASDPDDGETATLQVANVSYKVDAGDSSATAPAGFSLSNGVLTVDPGNTAFNHLAEGAKEVVVVSYDVMDSQSAIVSQTATITITGTNDPAVITGNLSGSVKEAGLNDSEMSEVSGKLLSADVDGPNNVFQAQSAAVKYGTYGVTADGAWTYRLNNENTTVNALGAGNTLTDGFLVVAADGTTQKVSITVNGANDVPTIISGTSATTVEHVLPSKVVYTAQGTDPDSGDSLTYSLGGADAGKFNIDTTTGAVTFKESPDFHAPTDSGGNNIYDIVVKATDAGGLSATQAVAISVTPPPTTLTTGVDTLVFSDFHVLNATQETLNAGDKITGSAIEGGELQITSGGSFTFGDGNGNVLLQDWPEIDVYSSSDASLTFTSTFTSTFESNGAFSVHSHAFDGAFIFDASAVKSVNFDVGANGRSSLTGGSGNDTLISSEGNDTLIGNAGADQLRGNAGRDTFGYLKPGDGGDHIQDFSVGDSGDILSFKLGSGAFEIGDNDSVVKFAAGFAAAMDQTGNEVFVVTDTHIQSASDAQGLIDSCSNVTTGMVFIFFNEAVRHAQVYYDADPSAGATASLLADLDNVDLAGFSGFSASNFMFS